MQIKKRRCRLLELRKRVKSGENVNGELTTLIASYEKELLGLSEKVLGQSPQQSARKSKLSQCWKTAMLLKQKPALQSEMV